MQKPTIGRVVHFFPATTDALYRNGEPLAATIVRVWSDTCVNLALFDGEAHLHARTSVLLYQAGSTLPDTSCAAWPAREGVQLEAKLANPHTGALRDLRDVASDPQAVLCVKPGEPLKAAPVKAAVTDEMVGRFLSWPLPEDFAPDCGISFTRSPHAGMNPTGTNLLHFGQAKAMLEHCINGPFASPITLPVIDPSPDSPEQEIQAKASNGPRVTPADIEAEIVAEHYFTAAQGVDGADIEQLRAQDQAAPLTLQPMTDDPQPWRTSVIGPLSLLTFCVLVLRNGAKVAGINYGAIDPAQHSAGRGRQEARAQAVDKVYELLGFRLRDKLVG